MAEECSGNCFSCAACYTQACKTNNGKFPDFCPTTALDEGRASAVADRMNKSRKLSKIAKTAAEVEGEYYCRMCRVEETIEYARRIGAKKIGIATCVGLLNETRTLSKLFDKAGLDHYVVCCKVGAIDKSAIGIPDELKIGKGKVHESMCNPILQAELLNEQGTDFNIIMGLCVGHDMLFTMHSKAPVTTLVVKDRVLGHNSVAALYQAETMYSRFKNLGKETNASAW